MPLFGPPNIEQLKAKRNVKGLVKALLYRKDAAVRESAAAALESLGWQPDAGEAGAAYWAVKHQWDKCVEIGARAVKPLLVALQDNEGSVRLAAAAALGQIGDAGAVSALVAALEDADAEVREAAVEALTRIGAPAVGQLIVLLKKQAQARTHTPGQLQAAALQGQGEALADDAQNTAAEALVRIGASAVEPLIATLKDVDWRLQLVAARALGRIGDARAEAPLRALVEASAAKAGAINLPPAVALETRASGIIMTTEAAKALNQVLGEQES
jgi:HEAT repeat protein